MSESIHIDLSEVVEKVCSVLMEPYTAFITKLHADGRITDAEVETLRHEVEDLIPRLYDLVTAPQSRDCEEESPPPVPDPPSQR